MPRVGDPGAEEAPAVLADADSEGALKALGYRRYVPPEYRHKGLLWWRSRLLQYYFRPLPQVWQAANRLAVRLGWPAAAPARCDGRGGAAIGWGGGAGVVGLHIRHGDKLQEEALEVPVSEYVDAAAGVARRHGLDWVFLASDSVVAANAAHRGLERAGLRVLMDKEELRNDGVAFSLFKDTRQANMTRYALDSLANLILLSRCEALVATFSSNFGRAAYELSYAPHPRFTPRMCRATQDTGPVAGWPTGVVDASERRQPGEVCEWRAAPVSLDLPWHADP